MKCIRFILGLLALISGSFNKELILNAIALPACPSCPKRVYIVCFSTTEKKEITFIVMKYDKIERRILKVTKLVKWLWFIVYFTFTKTFQTKYNYY